MKYRIDTGRVISEDFRKGEPLLVLDVWGPTPDGLWWCNALPTSGGSYAGGKATPIEAAIEGIIFLLSRGESRNLIIGQVFRDESQAVAEAMFGWLAPIQ